MLQRLREVWQKGQNRISFSFEHIQSLSCQSCRSRRKYKNHETNWQQLKGTKIFQGPWPKITRYVEV